MRHVRGEGGYTIAEGCMFVAVILFVVLLVVMLYVGFQRFGDPPPASEAPPALSISPD